MAYRSGDCMLSCAETNGRSRGREPDAWVAVHTQPHRESVAVQNLERQEFEVYIPRLLKRIRHARKAQNVLRPMFPGYVFVKVAIDLQHWRPIKSTIGVRDVVSCGNQLSTLSDAFIASLKAREVDGAIVRPESPYQIGQQIRIAGGPFDGLIGTILEMDERERLTVLMDLLNGRVKVNVEARWSAAL
jgi:transcriptional antiterminator RfaH